jgi:hypothetical protein
MPNHHDPVSHNTGTSDVPLSTNPVQLPSPSPSLPSSPSETPDAFDAFDAPNVSSAPHVPLSHRALRRAVDAATAAMAPATTGRAPEEARPRKRQPSSRSPRRTRLDAERAREWRQRKVELLEAVRELRADIEPSVQSPDLARALLFAPPRPQDVPPSPGERHRPRDADDRSEEAEAWRREQRAHTLLAEWRAQIRASGHRRWRPYGTWSGRGAVSDGTTTLGRHAERGGVRPGQSAWPTQWTAYLLRSDPAGTDAESGDGWGSLLGRAVKAVERSHRETPLWRVLWRYTDPRTPTVSMSAVAAEIGGSTRRAYRWLDAAARRLAAEIERIARGSRARARQEIREADEAEAAAWCADVDTEVH